MVILPLYLCFLVCFLVIVRQQTYALNDEEKIGERGDQLVLKSL